MLAIGLCLLGLGAFAARAAIQFDVFLGYDGIVPQASWFPVTFEIKNDGPPFVGTIELDGGRFNQEQVRRAVVELPTGTLKRFVLPVFAGARGFVSYDARLLDERGKLRAEQPGLQVRRSIGSQTPLIAAVVRTPGGAPTLRPLPSQDSSLQPAVARVLPTLFPDNPLVLDGVDTLYLSSEKAPELKVGQVKALLDWLYAGGHLILGVEQISEVTGTPWLRSLLPCEPDDIKTVQGHLELQEWLQSANWRVNPAGPSDEEIRTFQTYRNRGGQRPYQPNFVPPPTATPPGEFNAAQPFANLPEDPAFENAPVQVVTGKLRDGQVQVKTGDLPLVITAPRGRGQVTLLMFSPEREPFRSWKNLPTLWARLADLPGAWYVGAEFRQPAGWSSDGIFGAMLDTRQVHKLPVGWLLLLLVVYLAVIGPVDQYWLKRINRPMLTWITFPCYVVLFSLLIYVIGYKLRAGESEWNELHLVDVLPKSDQAELRGQTYASIYSPSNQRYLLEGRQEFSAVRGEFAGNLGAGQSAEKALFLQEGDGTVKAEIYVPVWTSQLFVNDWWQPAPVPLSGEIVPQGDGWQVKAENRTERPLANACVVVDDQVYALGEIPAQQVKTFTVSKAKGVPLTTFVLQHGAGFRSAVQARQRTFGGDASSRIDDLANGSIAASFLARVGGRQDGLGRFLTPPGLDLCDVVDRGNAVLLAWAPDYSPVKTLRQFSPRRSQKNTLWRLAIPVSSPKSKVQSPKSRFGSGVALVSEVEFRKREGQVL